MADSSRIVVVGTDSGTQTGINILSNACAETIGSSEVSSIMSWTQDLADVDITHSRKTDTTTFYPTHS